MLIDLSDILDSLTSIMGCAAHLARLHIPATPKASSFHLQTIGRAATRVAISHVYIYVYRCGHIAELTIWEEPC
jgi:hypothetical protein